MKTIYNAQFADGTKIQSESARKFNVAYKVTKPDGKSFTGFSISKEAAKQALSLCTFTVFKNDKSKEANKARQENSEYKSKCTIEIVSVI